jgi:hypothetical protein
MDATLEPLWRSGEKPFHGETVFPLDDVFVRDAIIAIPSALDHIAQHYPANQLFAFDDWHEHDGLIVCAKLTTLDELRRQVATPESYILSNSDDTAVYRAIYPDSREFLLRYSLWDTDEPNQDAADREVHWTFSGYGHDIAEMMKRWASYNIEVVPSAKYFRERHA